MWCGWAYRRSGPGAVALAVLALAVPAKAQQPGGVVVFGSLEFSAEADSNGQFRFDSPGTDLKFETRFLLGGLLETPTTRLRFESGATLRTEDLADRTSNDGFQDPFYSAAFDTELADVALSFDGTVRTSDLADRQVSVLDDDFVEQDLIISGGEVTTTTWNTEVTVGRDAPLGARLSYGVNQRDYSSDADASLFDRKTETIDMVIEARPSQVATVRVTGSNTAYSVEDVPSTRRTTDSLGVGLDYEIDPILRFSGDVSKVRIEETSGLGAARTTSTNTGVGLDLGLTRELPTGSVSLLLGRDIFATTDRNEVRIRHSVETPRAGYAYEIGLSDAPGSDPVVVASLDYSREFPMGLLSARLDRSTAVTDENARRERTGAQISYLHELSPLSAVTFGIDYGRSQALGGDATSATTTTTFDVVYNRQMPQDWIWKLGYRASFRDSESGNASSNAIFTTFGRQFSIRP